ncbi:GNAT family N-acetyltransferase [Candidatus Spongiihabitans sp.]|uniref:GNAT family N-acetyltransferase n=1 Tax=Candidatus Spongiihabitans sp. TaxID=3101308 RepID=UPI003C6F9FEC
MIADDAVKTLKIDQAKQALGKEIAAVVYDCFSGFDPDAAGILGGAIKAGGLMVLITPELPLWPEFDDPQFAKITAYGNPKPEFSYYIKRLIRIISESSDCILIQQHKTLPNLSANYQTTPASPPDFSDQNKAIESIKHVVYGQRRRPAILLSDRGRGKSAALGIAAGQLLQDKARRIGVTGNSKQSVANVFKHAALTHNIVADSLCFYPADKLIESKPEIDLLLIDEAASIPLSMLGRILEIFPRIAFTSTVHGYEGTGRGFMLRFKELLDSHCRGAETCILSTPIRWAQDDPLDAFLFDVLLLNAEPAGISLRHINKSKADNSKVDTSKFEFSVIEKSDLVENESLTRDVFGLLTQAHYRTRPHDLRHLLDAANIRLFGICQPGQLQRQLQQRQIIGVAVVAIEGGFDHETANKIWANQSRPKDHLLPELLCAQQGLIDAVKLKTARIMRIVVRPEFQRHGVGKGLLTHIFNFYNHEVDLLGTTFGANLAVLQFWLDSEFMPVRIGHNQSRNSATHACAMIKPISPRGNQLATLAGNKFSGNFRYQLRAVFPSIDPEFALLKLLCDRIA